MVTNETIEGIRAALAKNPLDVVGWLALADALEESGKGERAEATRLALKIQLDYPDVPDSSDFNRLATLTSEGIKPVLPEVLADGVTYYWVNSDDGDFWISDKIREKPRMTTTVATACEVGLFEQLGGCDSETLLVSMPFSLSLYASDGKEVGNRKLPYRRVFCPII